MFIYVCVCVCVARRYDVVELLCTFGADVNMKDNKGSSPYDVARVLGKDLSKAGSVYGTKSMLL